MPESLAAFAGLSLQQEGLQSGFLDVLGVIGAVDSAGAAQVIVTEIWQVPNLHRGHGCLTLVKVTKKEKVPARCRPARARQDWTIRNTTEDRNESPKDSRQFRLSPWSETGLKGFEPFPWNDRQSGRIEFRDPWHLSPHARLQRRAPYSF